MNNLILCKELKTNQLCEELRINQLCEELRVNQLYVLHWTKRWIVYDYSGLKGGLYMTTVV